MGFGLARPWWTSRLLRSVHLAALLGLGAAGLSACVADPELQRHAGPAAVEPPPAGMPVAHQSGGRRIAILLPLTGSNADVGQALLKAAQLALDQAGAPPLDAQDTGGTADGAATAARRALDAGAGIVLGPLTAPETAAAAVVTRAAGAPMLAFTSDSTQAQPGVWTLGITPGQQVRRLVLAMQAENKSRLAGLVPENPFGEALAAGLMTTASQAGLPPPRVVRTPSTFAGVNDALKSLSDYGNRRGALEAQQRSARANNDAEGRREAAEIGRRAIPPPPIDALLLGVSGSMLAQAVPLLSFYDIGPNQVRILGPATWAREAGRLSGLAGAWYAAPDPAARAGFEQEYTKKFNAPPRDFTSLAYDAAGIARAIGDGHGFSVGGLTRADGFAGADGLLALLPDGQVRRGLAIFEIDRGGSHIVQPAPGTVAAPGV